MDRIDLEIERQEEDEAAYYQQQEEEEIAEATRRTAALDADRQLLERQNFPYHWWCHHLESP